MMAILRICIAWEYTLTVEATTSWSVGPLDRSARVVQDAAVGQTRAGGVRCTSSMTPPSCSTPMDVAMATITCAAGRYSAVTATQSATNTNGPAGSSEHPRRTTTMTGQPGEIRAAREARTAPTRRPPPDRSEAHSQENGAPDGVPLVFRTVPSP